jgi:hypothetical protein
MDFVFEGVTHISERQWDSALPLFSPERIQRTRLHVALRILFLSPIVFIL